MPKYKFGSGSKNPPHKQVKNWFSTNILLKFAALALALFLWFYSVTNSIQQEQYAVPIFVTVVDTGLVDLSRDYGTAEVLLEGQGKEFIKLLWTEPRFEFAVAEKKPKKVQIALNPRDVVVPEGASLRPLAVLGPSSIEVELDWLIEKVIPVFAAIEPQEEGFVQKGKVTLEPEQVTLTGARKELRGLKMIQTLPVELPSEPGPFNIDTNLDLSGFSTLETVDGLITVRGELERLIERKMENVPIKITGLLKSNYRPEPTMISIIVTGTESRIAGLTVEDIEAVLEINNPPSGETYYSPKIVLPENVELINEQPKLFQAVPGDTLREAAEPEV